MHLTIKFYNIRKPIVQHFNTRAEAQSEVNTMYANREIDNAEWNRQTDILSDRPAE